MLPQDPCLISSSAAEARGHGCPQRMPYANHQPQTFPVVSGKIWNLPSSSPISKKSFTAENREQNQCSALWGYFQPLSWTLEDFLSMYPICGGTPQTNVLCVCVTSVPQTQKSKRKNKNNIKKYKNNNPAPKVTNRISGDKSIQSYPQLGGMNNPIPTVPCSAIAGLSSWAWGSYNG